ncbi:MAG: phosphotriesterase [Actinomycetota bacterium]
MSLMGVTGPVELPGDSSVLVHEHVVLSYPGDSLDPTARWDRTACIGGAVARMRELQQHGVGLFVDPCPIELGRDPLLLKEVSERSGMRIVCATGFYHEKIGIPYYWRARSADEVAELYLHEIKNGIGDSGVRPGAIKVASGDPPGRHDRTMIEAAATTARESGLPIITHCEGSNGWDVQLETFTNSGVDLSHVLIGHQDQQLDFGVLRAIAESGAFIGIDRVGYSVLAPEARRVDLVVRLIEEGFIDHLCLSMDHACCLRSPRFPFHVRDDMRASVYENVWPLVRQEMTERSHAYLFTDFLPMLRERGIGEDSIERIMVDNPRRLLSMD